MKHIIEIDDKTKAGKHLLGVVQTISAQNEGIVFLEEEADTVAFDVFAKELRNSVKKRLAQKRKATE